MSRTRVSRSATGTQLSITNALLLNGSTQYASIPSLSAYSLTTTRYLTLLMWIRADADPMSNSASTGYVNYLSKNSGANNHEWALRYYNTNNTETNLRGNENAFYLFSLAGGEGASALYRPTQYNLGRWILTIGEADTEYLTFNRDKEVTPYLGQTDWVTYPVTPGAATSPIYVGTDPNAAAGLFQGAFGPIKIFNRLLSSEEKEAQFVSNANNTNGLVGYWLADPVNNRLTDQTANANHGTLVGSPTFIAGPTAARPVNTRPRTPIKTQQVLLLNGSTQYASIADTSQTGLNVGTSDYLVCFRAKVNTSSATTVSFLGKYGTNTSSPNNTGGIGWDVIYSGTGSSAGNILFRRGDGSSTGSTSVSGSRLFDGGYHDIAIVSARSTNSAQIWIDGVKLFNGSDTFGNESSNGAFTIGASGAGNSRFLNGTTSNVWFYTWTTIPTDFFHAIEDLHWSGTTTYTNGLVSKWLMNGNANDSVGPNNLALTASPSFSNQSGRTIV